MDEQTKELISAEIKTKRAQMDEIFAGLRNEFSTGRGHVCPEYVNGKLENLISAASNLRDYVLSGFPMPEAPNAHFTVTYCDDWDEFVVRLYVNNEHVSEADYHTDCSLDARKTGELMISEAKYLNKGA